MFNMVPTGEMIKTYLKENGVTIKDVALKSNKSEQTVYKVLEDKLKLTYDIAKAVHDLIPEISVDFLTVYDVKYRNYLKENYKEALDNSDLIDYFKLKELFNEDKFDLNKLYEIGIKIYGEENFKNKKFPDFLYLYSIANNSINEVGKAWVNAAIYKCKAKKNDETAYKLDKEKLKKVIFNYKEISKATDFKTVINLIYELSKEIGIHYHFDKSIRNSRIKGVSLIYEGEYYIFQSDLFKSIESIWISYLHELYHIYFNDFDYLKNNGENVRENIELVNNKRVLKYFLGEFYDDEIISFSYSYLEKVVKITKTPRNIVCELFREINHTYDNYVLNSFIHFYKN